MAKNTSILVGDHFNEFIKDQVKTGRFSSNSEVVRAALRLFEIQTTKENELNSALEKGEKSGFSKDFDRVSFFNNMHEKHLK